MSMYLLAVIILLNLANLADGADTIQKGTTHSHTYMNADVIITYEKIGMKMCARRCIYQNQCEAINYNPKTFLCELLKAGGTSEVSTDYLYSPINTWTMDSDTCTANPCDNSEKCVKTKNNGHVCIKLATPCDHVVCRNGGTCRPGATSFTCICMVGYSGTFCEADVCDSSPCTNGGTCVASGTTWICQCRRGYLGTRCQTHVCDSSPCINGKICKVSGDTSYVCVCPNGYTGTTCDLCSFETGWCYFWLRVSTGQMNWVRKRSTTYTPDTGPTNDHTLGNYSGFYIYTESSCCRTGYIARVKSRPLTPTTSMCLEFYYHMYGATMGTLSVLQKTSTEEVTLWNKTGNQGTSWFINRITITGSSYEIVFEGARGEGGLSDMAVDDIMLRDRAC